jgi:PST family polysaccharide transporter
MTEPVDEPIAIESMVSPGLAVPRQTAISGTWAVGARLVSRVIDFVTMLVLARLLNPKDFGLVAIAMTVIYVMEAAFELPVSEALVRLNEAEPSHYDTAFTISLLRGVALGSIACLTSWPFAHFYADRRLLPLVCVLSLAPAARGLVSPKLVGFSKNLDFSPYFIMEFMGKVTAFLAAIVLAVTTRSYWAIAAGTVLAPVTSTIISYVLAPYRPQLSLSKLPAFSGFLGWITAAQVVSAFNWQTDRLLLGKLTSTSELGLFTAANDTANISVSSLFSPIFLPLLSAFTLLRENPKRLASSYQTSAAAIVTIGLPILVLESLIAYPLVRLVLGDKWLGSAPLLRWLTISLIPALFALPIGPLVMTFGRTHIFFKRNLFETCIKIPLIVFGAIKFGFMGVVLARCVSETATVCFCMIVVRKLIGLPIRDQILGPWRGIASTAVMAVVVWFGMPRLIHASTTASLATSSLLVVGLGGAVYSGTLLALWIADGCPSGLEAMVARKLSGLIKLRRRFVSPELS